jgi:predicted SAM-dependent methyltransferase
MDRLNFGCGNDYRNGWTNADGYAVYPYPFKDNSFDEIDAFHVIEHLDNPEDAMKEFYRILKPGGRLHIKVPHYAKALDWNFRHKKHFSTSAIDEFVHEDTQSEVSLEKPFKLISATRRLRALHLDVGGIKGSYYFDCLPIWDSIDWIVEKSQTS